MLAVNELETTGEHAQKESQDSAERITQTLILILRSPRFKDSLQLQSLLRYVVDESLKGNEDSLKERTIGIYVFGRRPDYDTTDDPIVRSRMGLLRKRLVRFYEGEEGERTSVHIVIPNGTYRPVFEFRPVAREQQTKALLVDAQPATLARAESEDATNPIQSTPAMILHNRPTMASGWAANSGRHLKIGAVGAAIVVLALVGAWWYFLRAPQVELDALWAPVLNSKQPIYVYTGTMPVYEAGTPEDEATSPEDRSSPIRLPAPPTEDAPEVGPSQVFSFGEGMLTGSVYADIRIDGFLNKYNRSPLLRSGPNLPFMDLKGAPLILIGSFDNYWTRVMNENLPFYFDRGFGIRERGGAHRRWYNPLKAEMTPRMMEDYALIFRVLDSKASAPVLGIAGLSTCGTHAAAEFVTDPVQMQVLSGISHDALKHRNIELVLHTSLVNCAPTSVQVIASKVW